MTKKAHSNKFINCLAVLLAAVLLISAGCGAGSEETANKNVDPDVDFKAPPKLSEFDAEIRDLKVANFDYIFAFTRKDGGSMNAEDKRFVKNNSHFNTNRYTLSSDNKVIFAGSNYKFPEAGLDALNKRFDVQNFSKPEDYLEKRRAEYNKKAEEEKKEREKKQK